MGHRTDLEFEEFARKHKATLGTFRGIQGGNSKIAQIDMNGSQYIIKRYLGHDERARKSCLREKYALTALQRYGVNNVPKLFEDLSSSFINCIEYLNGVTPASSSVTMNDIINFQCVMLEVHRNLKDASECLPLAVDAAFSHEDIFGQVYDRLKSTSKHSNEDWIKVAKSLEYLKCAKINCPPAKSAKVTSILSQSDIGSHNMLEVANQGNFFIDFEFFGVDSPQKLIIDFLLHPQNKFDTSLNEKFCSTLLDLYGLDLNNVIPWIPTLALKWATIMLRRMEIILQNSTEQKRLVETKIRFARFIELTNPSYYLGTNNLTQIIALVRS